MSVMSQTSEYALRAMTALALHDEDTLLPAAVIAVRANVPKAYLAKILHKLVVAKLILATKGPGGGFRLARPKDTIRYLDVMSAVGEAPDREHCAFGYARCNPSLPCPMHPAFAALNDELWRWASRMTLAQNESD